MSVNVGDKVRLLGWEGEESGLIFSDVFRDDVGRVVEVAAIDTDGTFWIDAVGWWPLSKVEKIEPTTDDKPAPKLFDPDNVTDWQSEGNFVFLLQETNRGCGTATENKFYFQVDSARRLNPDGERELAERICRLLNEDRQRREGGK